MIEDWILWAGVWTDPSFTGTGIGMSDPGARVVCAGAQGLRWGAGSEDLNLLEGIANAGFGKLSFSSELVANGGSMGEPRSI